MYGRFSCWIVSWMDTVTSWSLNWMPVNLRVRTRLQDVTVPDQEIVRIIITAKQRSVFPFPVPIPHISCLVLLVRCKSKLHQPTSCSLQESVKSASSVQVSTASNHVPNSMIPQAAKRYRSLHPEPSEKRFKADEELQTKPTCFEDSSTAVSLRVCLPVWAHKAQRPRAPELETPNKEYLQRCSIMMTYTIKLI